MHKHENKSTKTNMGISFTSQAVHAFPSIHAFKTQQSNNPLHSPTTSFHSFTFPPSWQPLLKLVTSLEARENRLTFFGPFAAFFTSFFALVTLPATVFLIFGLVSFFGAGAFFGAAGFLGAAAAFLGAAFFF
jgi:hypothetical protein